MLGTGASSPMRWNPFKKRDLPVAVAEIGQDQYTGADYAPDVASAQVVSSELPAETVALDEFVATETATTRTLTRLIRGVLIALVALLPVFILPFTAPGEVLTSSKQLLLYTADIVLLVLWLVLIMRQNGVVLKRSGLEWGILGLLVAGFLAAAFSQLPFASFLAGGGWLTLASGLLFFFLLINFFSAEEIPGLSRWLLLGGTVAVLLTLLAVFSLPLISWLTGGAVTLTTVGSLNALGALAVLLLILSLSNGAVIPEAAWSESGVTDYTLELPKTTGWWRVVKLAAATSSALLLVAINWWVFYLVLAVGMVVIIIAPGFVQRTTGWKLKFGAAQLLAPLIILVLALLLIFSSTYFSFNLPGKADLPIEVSLTQSSSSKIAGRALLAKPVLGYGQENFALAFDRFKDNSLNYTQFWSARFPNSASEFFNLLIEQGILGTVAWLFFFGSLFYYALRRQNNVLTATHVWLVMPTLAAAVALWFLYPYAITHHFVFWFLAGLLAIVLATPEKEWRVRMDDSSLSSITASLAFVLVLVLGLVGGYMLVQRYAGEIYFAKAAKLELDSPEKVEQAIGYLTTAVNTDQHDLRYLNSFSSLVLNRLQQELNNTKDKPEEVRARVQNLSVAIIQAAQRMQANLGNDAAAWLNSGLVFENIMTLVPDADGAAISAYEQYRRLAPQDPVGPVHLGSIYLARADNTIAAINNAKANKQEVKNETELRARVKEDYIKAEISFKQAIDLKRDLATALYNLGIVYERQNKLTDAIKQLELTRTANPSDAGLPFELGLLYYRNNKKTEAIGQLQQAVSLFKDFSNARWYLALMLEERGDLDGAKAQLREILALEVNKDNQTVKDKLAALESGQRELPPNEATDKQPLP